MSGDILPKIIIWQSSIRSTALFQLIQARPLRKFNDPWLFKAVIVTALGAALLVRIETG
jgi:hypothetical protein